MVKNVKNCFYIVLLTQSYLYTSPSDYPNWRKNPATSESIEAAKRLFKQKIDEKLQPKKQSAEKENKIKRFKKQRVKKVAVMLAHQNNVQFLSDAKIREEGSLCGEDASYQFIRESAQYDITTCLREAGYRLEDPISQEIYHTIMLKIESELEYYVKNKKSLWSYLQDSTKNIRDGVVRELAKRKPKISDNDITEVYPYGDATTTLARKTQGNNPHNGGLDRRPSCVTCKHPFGAKVQGKELKRVNLSCGHANICQDCLKKRLYESKAHRCPDLTCNKTVKDEEFPPSSLR